MKKETQNILYYLLLIIGFWLFTFVSLNIILKPYSIAYIQTGAITPGYLAYAIIGLLFSTPAPFFSVLMIALCREKLHLKAFLKDLFYTEAPKETVLWTAGFCLLALIFALFQGTPNGSPWYMLPLGFLVMIPFVGIAEETGWRGFLQPRLEKIMKFPFSILTTAVIWDIWHIDQWLDITSNHYGDSFIGFTITILIWSFALAALYKVTKSILACAIYHAFIDAIGAIYDWNTLFDAFPGDLWTNLYRILWLSLSIGLWLYADKRDKKRISQKEPSF